MREPESGDDSADPAMACIITLEEKRLGRFLNPREMDDLVLRFSLEDINPPIHPSREIFTKQTNQESRG